MKHIQKQPEPEDFSKWKMTWSNAGYKDLGKDKLFPGAQKARWALRTALVREQHGLCCYCETFIDDGNFHVEHFLPKDTNLFPNLQLEYSNLHACCRKNPSGESYEYCGHKKGNIYEPMLISPLEPDCESHFEYNMIGDISGKDERGRLTISVLNLNSSLLVQSRKRMIEYFEDLDDETYLNEINKHLNPEAVVFGEFYTTIQYLHETNLLH